MRSLVLTACLLLPHAAHAKGQDDKVTHARLTHAQTLDGVELPAGSALTYVAKWNFFDQRFEAPYLSGAVLGADARPCGVPLAAGAEVSFSNGRFGELGYIFSGAPDRVMSFTAPGRMTIDGVKIVRNALVKIECANSGHKLRAAPLGAPYDGFPSGSRLTWFPVRDGAGVASAIVPDPTTVRGFAVPGGALLTFRADGSIESIGGPAGTVMVDGVTCALDQSPEFDKPSIKLYPDGRLARCGLPAHGKTTDWRCKDAADHMQLCDLSDVQTVRGLDVTGAVEMYPSGALKSTYLPREQVIDGFSLLMKLELYENGHLQEGTAVRPHTIDGVTIHGQVSLYPSGKLKHGRFNAPQTVHGLDLADSVELYEDGTLHGGNLVHDQKVGDRMLSRGTLFELARDGHVLQVYP